MFPIGNDYFKQNNGFWYTAKKSSVGCVGQTTAIHRGPVSQLIGHKGTAA